MRALCCFSVLASAVRSDQRRVESDPEADLVLFLLVSLVARGRTRPNKDLADPVQKLESLKSEVWFHDVLSPSVDCGLQLLGNRLVSAKLVEPFVLEVEILEICWYGGCVSGRGKLPIQADQRCLIGEERKTFEKRSKVSSVQLLSNDVFRLKRKSEKLNIEQPVKVIGSRMRRRRRNWILNWSLLKRVYQAKVVEEQICQKRTQREPLLELIDHLGRKEVKQQPIRLDSNVRRFLNSSC